MTYKFKKITNTTELDFTSECIGLNTEGNQCFEVSCSTGEITIAGEYTLPITDGEPNQVLQTDGNGQLSWANQATGGSGSSEDYEFGSWTPQGNGFTFTIAEGHYQKFGRMVTATFKVRFPQNFPGSAGSNEAQIKNLPYTSMPAIKGYGAIGHMSNGQSDTRVFVALNNTLIKIVNHSAQTKQNANFSDALLHGGVTYFISGSI